MYCGVHYGHGLTAWRINHILTCRTRHPMYFESDVNCLHWVTDWSLENAVGDDLWMRLVSTAHAASQGLVRQVVIQIYIFSDVNWLCNISLMLDHVMLKFFEYISVNLLKWFASNLIWIFLIYIYLDIFIYIYLYIYIYIFTIFI